MRHSLNQLDEWHPRCPRSIQVLGFELSTGRSGTRTRSENPGKNAFPSLDDAHSDARPAETGANPAETPALLARLLNLWPRLSGTDSAEVVALAERLAGDQLEPRDALADSRSHSEQRMANPSSASSFAP